MASKRARRGVKHNLDTTAAEIVAAHDDLLTEILIRMPIRAIIKCKRVSKKFRSLVSSIEFARSYALREAAVKKQRNGSGLFLYSHNNIRPGPRFLPFSDGVRNPRIRVPGEFPTDTINILQSCEGLFLCCSDYALWKPESKLYVCNATTRQSVSIPHPGFEQGMWLTGIGFAFDPFKSAEYKIVTLWKSVPDSESVYTVKIYSSVTRSWRPSNGGILVQRIGMPMFTVNGVFLKGALHWLERDYHAQKFQLEIEFGLSFDIRTECLKPFQLPPRRNGSNEGKARFSYFGACGGHLLLIEKIRNNLSQDHFVVFEMSDSSEWCGKCCLNFSDLRAPDSPGASVLSVMKGNEKDGLIIVMSVASRIFSYSPKSGTRKVLQLLRGGHNLMTFDWCHTFQYTESLYPV